MKNKMPKSAIFALLLTSFNIPTLTNWVTRADRDKERLFQRYHRYRDREKTEAELREQFEREIASQPKTIGQLIEAYKYRFEDGNVNGYCSNAVGKKTIIELKQKLVELGLTPDDWPALVPHDQILARLSKQGILTVLVREIFPTLEEHERKAYSICVGWTEEEGKTKTVRDLIQFDPSNLPDEQNELTSYVNRSRFFFERKRFFVRLRHELVKKGFSVKDGKFFAWDPNPSSLDLVMQVLKKHKLSPSEIRKFAKIVVAERWII